MTVSYCDEAQDELALIYATAAPEDRSLITASADAAEEALRDAEDDSGSPLTGHVIEPVVAPKLASRVPSFRWGKLRVVVIQYLFFVVWIDAMDETAVVYFVGRRRIPLADL